MRFFHLLLCSLLQWRISAFEGPWIGILGLPASVDCDSRRLLRRLRSQPPIASSGGSCFTNVYDKWVQSAGARAVGIPFDAVDGNRTSLDELLHSIDGVIFTGGGIDLSDTGSQYFRTGSYIFQWVQARNDNGFYFPLRGHCMGFQFLAILAAGSNSSVLLSGAFDSENLSLPLEWTSRANRSQLVHRMPPEVFRTFTVEPATTNLHHDGVTPSTFRGNPELPRFFDMISTNHDRKGLEFVSTMEAKHYPIMAVQWHPERNQFEWTPGMNINHAPSAVAANNWMALDFISESWKHVQSSHADRVRNWALLRKLSTFAMKQVVADGDILNGLTYLMFEGLGSSSNTASDLPSSSDIIT